jgi:hypothetical protein
MLKRLLPSFAIALAALFALPAVASAHETWAFHGADSARVLESHRYIEIYDHECDGHSVYTRYRMSNGNLGQFSDADGCGGNRAYRNMPSGIRIVRFQICETGEGCSAIKVA